MRITKRQLKRIIQEEKAKLRGSSDLRSRLHRIIREQGDAGSAGDEERAGASASELKNWFRDKVTTAGDLGVPSTQIPALIASMEDLIATAAAGKLKSKEAQMSKQISRLGGLGEADDVDELDY